MRAVLTMGHGDRTQLRFQSDFPDPALSPEGAVVRVAATALNFHDIFTRRGMPGIKIPLPIIVGSDIAGRIHSVGSQVNGWNIGDRVLIDPVPRGEGRGGMIGEMQHGGRAEFVAVPADQLVPIPAGVTLEAACALPLAYGTAYRMMVTQGQIRAGERVLILGASGGVGVACVQLAKLAGAEVIACASSTSKLNRLKELGADYCIDYTTRNLTDAVREICGKPRMRGGGGVDVAVNFTGGNTWIDTQKCVALGGRILTCGATAGFDVRTDVRYLWTFEHRIVGSNGWMPSDLVALLELVQQKQLQPVIDKVLPLEECVEAERLLEHREVFGKVLLAP